MHEIDTGSKLKVLKQINTSYGTLNIDEIVTVEEIIHFPTRFNVTDKNGKNWILYTHDFEEINEE